MLPNLIPTAYMRVEQRVANSRFIATAAPTPSVAAARQVIAEVRSEMPEANHHVYAYVIGHGATTTMGMSDAGEPPGTAGRPILSVLKGSGFGDITVVVTRFFGGTLLGTGGLVHAYANAARDVLAAIPCEAKIERCSVRITVDYANYEHVKRLLAAHDGRIAAEQFAADVTLEILLPSAAITQVSHEITEYTSGQAQIIS